MPCPYELPVQVRHAERNVAIQSTANGTSRKVRVRRATSPRYQRESTKSKEATRLPSSKFRPPGPSGPRDHGNKTGIGTDLPGSATAVEPVLRGGGRVESRDNRSRFGRGVSVDVPLTGPSLQKVSTGRSWCGKAWPTSALAHRHSGCRSGFWRPAWFTFLRGFAWSSRGVEAFPVHVGTSAAGNINTDPSSEVFKIVNESSFISVPRY